VQAYPHRAPLSPACSLPQLLRTYRQGGLPASPTAPVLLRQFCFQSHRRCSSDCAGG
jgi:hypothetical protein